MTRDLTATHRPVSLDEARRMTASWPDLLHSRIQTEAEAKAIAEAAHSLRTPATRQWIAGRVATLLSQYFASSIPVEMMTAIAEDWDEELRGYPAWAVNAACRWWMGRDNPDHRKKPLPGDIAARAEREVGVVAIAENAVRRFIPNAKPPEPRQPATEEQRQRAAEILKAAGFRLNRFGGVE